MDKKYILKRPGNGYMPHLLQNADDTKDVLELCSCGGTHNKDGTCDGTHKTKGGCSCNFCKTQDQKTQ